MTKNKNDSIINPEPFQRSKRGVDKYEALILTAIFTLVIYSATKSQSSLIDNDQQIRNLFWNFNLLIVVFSFFMLPKKKDLHPGLNVSMRLIQSFAIAYILNILLWALLPPDMLQNWLAILDPSIKNVEYEERSFSIDCRLYTPENPESNFANLKDTIDVFVAGHLIGWVVKAMIFRNNILAWTMSILFEIHEISLKHWLPNFNECWWDHTLLDLFGMNLLGIIIGNYIMNKLKFPKFHWFFEPTQESEKLTYFQRFTYALTSAGEYAQNNKWNFLSTPRKFLAVTWVLVLASVTDLSWFFLKNSLNLAPSQLFMGLRIWIVGLFSIIIVQDFYKWVKLSGHSRLISFNVILGHVGLFLEAVVFLKNKKEGFFDPVTPRYVKAFWGGVLFLFLFGLTLAYINSKKKFISSN